jgi:hypothetical protein
MDKAQVQKSPSTTTGKQNSPVIKNRAPQNNHHLHSFSNNSFSQTHHLSNNLTPGHLAYLQHTLGNQAVGRIIQAKLSISEPDDPYEREADQVADKVMRMPEPETPGEEETKVQTKPLAGQITPLVHRMPEPMAEKEQPPVQAMHDEGTAHDEETTVAAKPLIQRVPLAVREDDDEEKVAPKLEASEDLQQEKEEKPVQAKPANDSFIQRQSQEDEEKKEETPPAAPMIHREMDEEKEEEIQAKMFPGSVFKVPTVLTFNVRSTSPTVQRLCTECAEEMQEEEGKPVGVAQRKPARYQLHDDHDEEETKVTPKLEPEAELEEEEKKKAVQAKLEIGTDIQRQAKDDEEKEEEALQSTQPIQRQMEEEDEEAVQAKPLTSSPSQFPSISPVSTKLAPPILQRLCAECEEELAQTEPVDSRLLVGRQVRAQRKEGFASTPQVTPSVSANIRALQGGGSPLPPATRAFFEPRFGADFSQVRVHTGARAAETAKSINARAFTVGRDIAFGTGQCAPESPEGRRLFAHELTHVVQQAAGINRAIVYLQPQGPTDTPGSPDQLIDKYTTLGFLDEEGLGRDLAGRLPGQHDIAKGVLESKKLSDSDKDDVAYEITIASGGKLPSINEDLRMTFVREMVGGIVTDKEEEAIANIWISFSQLPEVAGKNQYRSLWKKSLRESDQLREHIKPIKDAFVWDVTGVARAYLEENKSAILAEGGRFGIKLGGESEPVEEQKGYLEDIMSIAVKVRQLQKDRDKLRDINVGYKVQYVRGSRFEYEETFNPESSPPPIGPKGSESPPIPTWEQVNDQHIRLSAVISGFANLYPSIYTLIQQDKLDEVAKQGDAAKAREMIAESLRKTLEKIRESDEKIVSDDITYYDLVPIHTQLFSGAANPLSLYRYPWNQPYYTDIANYDLAENEAREFWVKLGLSLVAAAALIAAPFTGGATAAILVGLGIGIGAGQAAVSWEKYLDLAKVGDAHVRDELALIGKGQVSGALVDAILDTVAVFLDAYGARAAKVGARTTRLAVEAAEKELKEKIAEEARKRMLREGAKDVGINAVGTGAAIAQQELFGEEEPDIEAICPGYDIDLPPDSPEAEPETVSRLIIQRNVGTDYEIHIEGALRRNEIGGLPKMIAIIPGQYSGSGHGIDRIGISIDKADRITVWHFEMKFVSPGSPHVPGLGTPKVGTQLGEEWTRKAIRGLLDSNKPEARAALERLRRAMKKMPRYQSLTITKELMEEFLTKRVPKAPTRIIIPSYADLSRLYKQVAALIKHGRRVKIKRVP